MVIGTRTFRLHMAAHKSPESMVLEHLLMKLVDTRDASLFYLHPSSGIKYVDDCNHL